MELKHKIILHKLSLVCAILFGIMGFFGIDGKISMNMVFLFATLSGLSFLSYIILDQDVNSNDWRYKK